MSIIIPTAFLGTADQLGPAGGVLVQPSDPPRWMRVGFEPGWAHRKIFFKKLISFLKIVKYINLCFKG